jgi:hypothetical protein
MDPNALSKDRTSPMLFAAMYSKSSEGLELMVQYGGSIDAECVDGYTPWRMIELRYTRSLANVQNGFILWVDDDFHDVKSLDKQNAKQMLQNVSALAGDREKYCKHFDEAEFEELATQVRYRVYFAQSLVARLLQTI